jgi:hypothetical protein
MATTSPDIRPISRRGFLKTGLAGALVLATAGGIYRLTRAPEQLTPFALDPAGQHALAAIAPVMLKGAIEPASPHINTAIERVLEAIAGLPLATQKEIQDLFALLTLAPTRRLLAGVSVDWPEADEAEVTSFLQNWRTHRLAMFQTAYQALHDLITGSWYANESSWASIGYPGPMKELS